MRIGPVIFQFWNGKVEAVIREEDHSIDARRPSVVLDNIKVVYPLLMDCLTA